ncbi:MAG: 30S ribosomal protein S20 [Gemmataceae bacterium]|nr:30S ribosomal protein S20 [Gemmataceae bacterium]
MPHTKSAKKRMRQYEKRRRYNRAYKKSIKEAIKEFLVAKKSGDATQTAEAFKKAVKRLDMAAARRVIHPNKANRKKSQLAKKLASQAAPARTGSAPKG